MANELVAMCWLIDFPTPPMRLVMMKICDCADPDGTNIFPSVATVKRETGLGESTIRQAIAAFEECGLLIVKENKFGNRAGKTTTVRELDTDRLRLVTGKRRKGQVPVPSTHVMARQSMDIPADTEVVTVPGAAMPSIVERRSEPRTGEVWAIFPRARGEADGTPPGDGGVGENSTPPGDGGAPLHDTEGGPSRSWTPPLQELDPTPPGAGPNPSLDPSIDPPPQSPRKRGARGRDLIEDVRKDKPHCQRAITNLLEPLLANIRYDAPNPAFSLGTLAEWIEKQSDDVIAEAYKLLTTPGEHHRSFNVRPTNIENAVRDARRIVEGRAAARNGPLIFKGTPEFAAMLSKVAEQDPAEARWLGSQEVVQRKHVAKYLADIGGRP